MIALGWERAAAVGAGLAAVLALAGCDVLPGPPTATASATKGVGAATPVPADNGPAAAVRAYFATLHDDCAGAFQYLTDPLRSVVGSASRLCQGSGPSNTSTEVAAVSVAAADKATVQVTVVKADGSTHQDTVTVVLRGAYWLVADIAVNGRSGGPSQADDEITRTITSQYEQQRGAQLQLHCPAAAGPPEYTCSYTDSAARSGHIQVTFAGGSWTWHLTS